MEIQKSASAGTLESSDVYVEAEPNEGGIRLQIQSVVTNLATDYMAAGLGRVIS